MPFLKYISALQPKSNDVNADVKSGNRFKLSGMILKSILFYSFVVLTWFQAEGINSFKAHLHAPNSKFQTSERVIKHLKFTFSSPKETNLEEALLLFELEENETVFHKKNSIPNSYYSTTSKIKLENYWFSSKNLSLPILKINPFSNKDLYLQLRVFRI